MIVWKYEGHLAGAAPSVYETIRRDGAVVPFDPSKIAIAMMKAFLAARDALSFRDGGWSPFDNLQLGERQSIWRCQIRLLALGSKRDILDQGNHAKRTADISIQFGARTGQGFFSAAKPNLRNAP